MQIWQHKSILRRNLPDALKLTIARNVENHLFSQASHNAESSRIVWKSKSNNKTGINIIEVRQQKLLQITTFVTVENNHSIITVLISALLNR